MNLSFDNLAWLAQWFKRHGKKLPHPRKWVPLYNATSWDLDDLFACFRRDALYTRNQVWTTLLERDKTGAWPKMQTSDAFWLRARWHAAEEFCNTAIAGKMSSATSYPGYPPTDVQAAIKWLVLDLWDEQLVDEWICQHARDYVYTESYGEPETADDLERYLDNLENPSAHPNQD